MESNLYIKYISDSSPRLSSYKNSYSNISYSKLTYLYILALLYMPIKYIIMMTFNISKNKNNFY